MHPKSCAAVVAAGLMLFSCLSVQGQEPLPDSGPDPSLLPSAAVAATASNDAELAARYQQLLSENLQLQGRLQDLRAKAEESARQLQAVQQAQLETARELSVAHQSQQQLQVRFESQQRDLQGLQQQNLQLALAMADERQHARAVNEQNASLVQQYRQLQQRVAAHAGASHPPLAEQNPAATPHVGLGVGKRLRLAAPTVFTTETEGGTDSQMLPEGSTVTVLNSPSGGKGFYAVSTEQGQVGWINVH